MPTIVTIKSSAPAAVVSERIVDDGRERHENGFDYLEADVEQAFIVHKGQSLRIVELPPKAVEPAAPIPAPAATPTATKKGDAA